MPIFRVDTLVLTGRENRLFFNNRKPVFFLSRNTGHFVLVKYPNLSLFLQYFRKKIHYQKIKNNFKVNSC